MPQGVGRSPHIKPRLFAIHRNQFLNRPNREMPAQPILEQRPIRRDGEPNLVVEGQKFHDTRLSHFVEWNHATPRVFALKDSLRIADGRRKMQVAPGTAIMIHQTNRETGRFADAEAGVVHKQDQQVIPAAEGRSKVDGVEDATDFVF